MCQSSRDGDESNGKRMNYQQRLDRVVDYIYEHLDEEIDLNRLAEEACLSSYHWHRIYVAMRGETITTTVKRLRLHRASDRLANSDVPIVDIAGRAGYSSTAAFSRAFRKAYSQAPATYRREGSHARFKTATQARDDKEFEVVIESLSEQRCAAVFHQGSYLQIDRAMGSLFGQLGEQQLFSDETQMIAVFYDDPDFVQEQDLRARACSPVAAAARLRAPLEELMLPGGSFARLRHRGPYADMKDAYRWLYGVWLPRSAYEAGDVPGFESYLNNPQDVAPTELLTDIHLPLVL